MNREADNNELLADVLAEAAHPDFREALLGETLRLVRRRRRFRQTPRVMAVFVGLGLIAIVVHQNLPKRQPVLPPAAKTVKKSYSLARTQSMPAGAIVDTRPFATRKVIPPATTVEVVQTAATGRGVRIINDDELLALAAPRPAMLLRLGPHLEKLIFVNPADEKGFPLD